MYCSNFCCFTRKILLYNMNVAQKKIFRLITVLYFRKLTALIFDDPKLIKFENCSVWFCLLLVFKLIKYRNHYGWFYAHEKVAHNTRNSSMRNPDIIANFSTSWFIIKSNKHRCKTYVAVFNKFCNSDRNTNEILASMMKIFYYTVYRKVLAFYQMISIKR